MNILNGLVLRNHCLTPILCYDYTKFDTLHRLKCLPRISTTYQFCRFLTDSNVRLALNEKVRKRILG